MQRSAHFIKRNVSTNSVAATLFGMSLCVDDDVLGSLKSLEAGPAADPCPPGLV